MTIRSRFAPSPTGYLHIGGARTALYAWAFARRYGGTFILRIEDTDVERSTPEAVQAILDGMQWLGLTPDEGPFYQMRRMSRYKEAIDTMLAAGTAYHCYMSAAELDQLREAQRARGHKPRYDGTWRPEPGKTLPPIPAGVQPVVRFRNPEEGVVAWEDAVKGRIEIANAELDDLVIARADGTPTYNFCVCVDDWDMKITHVIRGDDHVNNTPRQINILQALGAKVPVYAHLSMILGDDGQKLSKRHGAVSVMEYPANGYVRDAVLNYLARLGWSHGDDEVFSMAQFCEWFDLDHITPSAAQFNTEKLNWLNHEYIKQMHGDTLGGMLRPFLLKAGLDPAAGPDVVRVAELLRDRAPTLVEMAAQAHYFYARPQVEAGLLAQHLSDAAKPAVVSLAGKLAHIGWTKADVSAAIKAEVAQFGLKMPQLMMPLRVLLTGQTQTPGVDAVIEVLGREEVLARLERANLRAA
ncbi:MAG: glutamate--tRNA ligase [Rhodocyclaceae bacterium]|nr:glutamate--tRNA ligase [Rhodocyclaceae bacterium]